MQKGRLDRLGTEPVPSLLLSMCTQTTLSLVLYSIYSLTDTFFIARGVSAYAAGGVSLTQPLLLLLGAVSTTMGTGGASIISRALGKGDRDKAASTAANVFLVFWIMALLVSVVGVLFLTPFMRLLGAEEILMPYAKGYARIILLGAITSTGFSALIRAEGNTRFSLYIWIFPVLINLILDPLFILVFQWGVEGAALATVAAQATSAGMSLYYFFFSKRDAYRIQAKHFRLRGKLIGEILSIGSPTLISQIGLSLFTTIVNQMLLHFGGAMAIAAFGIVSRIQGFLVIPQNGIVQGMQPIIGYNFAAKAFLRVRQTTIYALIASAVYGTATMVAGIVLAKPLVAIFIADAAILELAISVLSIIALSFPFKGVPTIVSAVFQAEGKPLNAAALLLGGIFAVQLPLLLLMTKLFSLTGAWVSFVLADGLMCVLSLWLVIKRMGASARVQLATEKEEEAS